MGSIEKFFLGAKNLPAMPDVARQLVASFDDEGVDLHTVVRLTARNEPLALKVIRVAQSHRQSPASRGAIRDLNDAASALGMEQLRKLVLAASIAEAFPSADGLERIGFWKHAIATGCYAHWFARILGVDADSGYLAGFLLRSGQLLMACELPDAIAGVETQCTVPGARYDAEIRAIGCSHPQVTAELARRWRLPKRFVDAFVHAADPLAARPFSLLAAVLNMAAIMADAGALGVPASAALEQANPRLLEHLRLDVPWLQSTAPSYEQLTAPIDELLA
jgi:HD-like signal output (HDOD) protein